MNSVVIKECEALAVSERRKISKKHLTIFGSIDSIFLLSNKRTSQIISKSVRGLSFPILPSGESIEKKLNHIILNFYVEGFFLTVCRRF